MGEEIVTVKPLLASCKIKDAMQLILWLFIFVPKKYFLKCFFKSYVFHMVTSCRKFIQLYPSLQQRWNTQPTINNSRIKKKQQQQTIGAAMSTGMKNANGTPKKRQHIYQLSRMQQKLWQDDKYQSTLKAAHWQMAACLQLALLNNIRDNSN